MLTANKFRSFYSKSLIDGKVLFTGHSHRAWPDAALEGQNRAIELAQSQLDKKWSEVFSELIPEYQGLVAKRAGVRQADLIANDENTHNLLVRVLSCFPWNEKTKIVTTSSEFYSLRRQLKRLEEEGVRVNYVDTADKETLVTRIIDAIDEETDIVMLSTVFFDASYKLLDSELREIINKARSAEAQIFLDAYHHFNIRSLDIDALGDDVFVVGGGYKYAQSGEGAAWMKVPANCELRPMVTGWFADFAALEGEEYPYPVNYSSGAARFYGATRDISGLSRAIAVMQFMDEHDMSVKNLEANNLEQINYLIKLYDDFNLENYGLKLKSPRAKDRQGPFLALEFESNEKAIQVQEKLIQDYKIYTDTRTNVLRLGPAEYTSNEEMEFAMDKLHIIVKD